MQEVLNPASGLFAFAPDLVVIAPNWRDMVAFVPIDASANAVDAVLAPKVSLLRAVWGQLVAKRVKIVQHVLVPPTQHYRGMAERLVPASSANQLHRLNAKLLDAGRGLVTWVDMESLANGIGTRRFSSAKLYYAAKLDHDPKFLPDYLPLFRAAWRSVNARAKKVLVLDLDNTLWGGTIGDDGLQAIVLGFGSPAGEAFHDWQ